jgi:asparagine synthase (glutamine-hydrolysing)
MCGISGVARIDGAELGPGTDELLTELTRCLAHRGPDDSRVLRDGPVGFAFTRLSLVDPVGGGQPLSTEDGSLVLIANGEVYNHRELEAGLPGVRMRTGSDCEVLLHLYQRDGLRFLDKVNGMFAFVLWDRRKHRLLICRDRFGIKPLFFHRTRERLVFASEIKALFADPATPRRLDWRGSLADHGLTAAPAFTHEPVVTWFEDIELAPAATILTVDLRTGATSEHRYWSLPAADDASDASDEEYATAYGELLAASVRDCATADTELGLFLSGGIDSAAVAALSGYEGLPTFTALSGATLLNGDVEGARRTAELLGLPHHQVLFPADRVPDAAEWKKLLWLLESPLCGPEQFYKYELHRFAKHRYPQLRGMLLGAASDEFNGGYSPGYASGGWPDFMAALGELARGQRLERRPGLARWWEPDAAPLLTDAILSDTDGGPDPDLYDAYVRWKWRSIQQYNVWHEDRTAAGNGVEARVPFLDHRLVELSVRVPAARRESLLWNKRILRQAMKGVLPPEVLDRPKVPFFHGDGARHTYRTFVRMLTDGGGALLDEALSSPRAREFVDADGLRASLRRLERDPDSGHLEVLLRVVNLGLLESMTADLPAPPASRTAGPPPVELSVPRGSALSRDDLAGRVLSPPVVDPELCFALHDDVLLTRAAQDPGMWYLLVDGTCAFTLDEREEPAGVAVLRALRPGVPLVEVLAATGRSWGEVVPFLGEAVEAGLLRVTPGVAAPELVAP